MTQEEEEKLHVEFSPLIIKVISGSSSWGAD